MPNYKTKIPRARKEKYVYHHECSELKKIEGAEIIRYEHQVFFDFIFYEYEFAVSIDYCPYCGVKLMEQEYLKAIA